jgi:hypothetical protein
MQVAALLTQLNDPTREGILKAHKRAVIDLELRNESLQQQLDAATAESLEYERKPAHQRQQVIGVEFGVALFVYAGELLQSSTAVHEIHVRCETLAAQLAAQQRENTAQREEIQRLEV